MKILLFSITLFVAQIGFAQKTKSSPENSPSTKSSQKMRSGKSVFYSLEELKQLTSKEKLEYVKFLYSLTAMIEVVYYNQKETDPAFYVSSYNELRKHKMQLFMEGLLPYAEAETQTITKVNNTDVTANVFGRIASTYDTPYDMLTSVLRLQHPDLSETQTTSAQGTQTSSGSSVTPETIPPPPIDQIKLREVNENSLCIFGARMSHYVKIISASKNVKPRFVCAPPPNSINPVSCRDSKNPKKNPKYQCPSFGIEGLDKQLCIYLYEEKKLDNLSERCVSEFEKHYKQPGVTGPDDNEIERAASDLAEIVIVDGLPINNENNPIKKFCYDLSSNITGAPPPLKVQKQIKECNFVIGLLQKYENLKVENHEIPSNRDIIHAVPSKSKLKRYNKPKK